MDSYEKLETACGAPLYFVEMPQTKSVAIGILVHAGTRNEEWPREAGLAHAFEHIVFQGTKLFPTSKALTNRIESVGGRINAWTGKEHTFFYDIMPADNFGRGIGVLHQMLTASLFKLERIAVEMKNIVEEIKRAEDNPRQFVVMLANEALYNNHSLGKRTLGTVEAVTSFTQEDFIFYRNRFYHPANYTFIVAGNVRKDVVLQTINTLFVNLLIKEQGDFEPRTESSPNRRKLVVVNKDIKQMNICLNALFRLDSVNALDLFSSMISGGMSFPLFQEVRDKLGLCYEIGAGVSRWSDWGNFTIYVGTDANRWKLALDKIFEVIEKSFNNERLFKKSKKALIGSLKTGGYESPPQLLSKMVEDIISEGRPKTLEETIQEIQGITLAEVAFAVRTYLRPDMFTRAFVAPKDCVVE